MTIGFMLGELFVDYMVPGENVLHLTLEVVSLCSRVLTANTDESASVIVALLT